LSGEDVRKIDLLGLEADATAGGDGDRTLTLVGTTVSANTGEIVGGILNGAPVCRGLMVVRNSLISNNRGIPTDDSPGIGGIFNFDTLTMTNSTVSGNRGATLDLEVALGITNLGNATLINTTLYGVPGDDSAVLSHSDVDNSYVPAMLTVTNTVVFGECRGKISSHDYNIESPGKTCGFDQQGDQVNVPAEELNLGPLADNGGPTMTHAVGASSVAIDAIPGGDCVDADGQLLTADQRGDPRPAGTESKCDVGAFEAQQ
jgi:hypothetical protein